MRCSTCESLFCLFCRVEKEKAQAAEQAKVRLLSSDGMLGDFHQGYLKSPLNSSNIGGIKG